mmetsp:Transcript_104510/g.337052  ORF Transcript_104510/g.337052 Transcript_104510/m.337052 type:complete len:348 (-) Transcript_104510:12-1055(-)
MQILLVGRVPLVRAGPVVPGEGLRGAHARHVLEAVVLAGVAVPEVRAPQREVARIVLLDQAPGLGVEVAGPRLVAAVDVDHVVRADLDAVAVRLQQRVRGQREGVQVQRGRDRVRPLEVVGLHVEVDLRDLRGVAHQRGQLGLHEAVQLASAHAAVRGELPAPGRPELAAEVCHKPLMRVPEQAEDRLVAEVPLRQVLGPEALGGVVHGVAQLRRHLQVRVHGAPDGRAGPQHRGDGAPALLGRAGHLAVQKRGAAAHGRGERDAVAEVHRHVDEGKVLLSTVGRAHMPDDARDLQQAHVVVSSLARGGRKAREKRQERAQHRRLLRKMEGGFGRNGSLGSLAAKLA